MMDQDEDMEDIENRIPAHNLMVNANNCQLKVVRQRQDTQGFLETNIEIFQLPSDVSTAPQQPAPINNQFVQRTICISIEDLKNNCSYEDELNCWRFNNIFFKTVLIYGRVTIKNEVTKDDKSYYTLSVDDETEAIDGFLNKSTQQETSKNKQSMTIKRNELERRRKETGINLRGKFFSTDSNECQLFLSNLKSLQEMIQKNFKMKEKRFNLGTLKENCLVHAFPYQNINHEFIKLSIIDLVQCESLELSWKRNLNKSNFV